MNDQVSPTWAEQLIKALQALWPVDKPLELVLAGDDHLVWTLHDDAAVGACNIRPDRITIYLRSYAQDTEYWRDVLIHEYTHAAMSALLEATSNEVPTGIEAYRDNAYVQQMETVTMRVASLLEYAVRTGATVRA
jgi:hypothetical protein